MMSLLGALLGFLGSLVPELLKQAADWRDKQHELKLLQLQIQQAASQQLHRMEEIGIQAEAEASKALYTTWKSGIDWVDALNGTVRPVIAYAFFGLYACLKLMQFSMLDAANPLPWQVTAMWNEEDQAIFAGIISFYFGSRSLRRQVR
jgi:Holin of 3TMs, for gene-transfer release